MGASVSTGAATVTTMAAAGAAAVLSRMLPDTNSVEYNLARRMQGHFKFKMNTDGACRPTGHVPTYPNDHDQLKVGPSGFGGILRDHHGKWVCGFRGFLGVTDSLTAEFHGIFRGLLLLDKLCLEETLLESDSAEAVQWIHAVLESNSVEWNDDDERCGTTIIIKNCWDIIKECKRLVNKNRITIRCFPRDANRYADKLANMGIDRWQEPYIEIIDLPVEIKQIVDRESSMF